MKINRLMVIAVLAILMLNLEVLILSHLLVIIQFFFFRLSGYDLFYTFIMFKF